MRDATWCDRLRYASSHRSREILISVKYTAPYRVHSSPPLSSRGDAGWYADTGRQHHPCRTALLSTGVSGRLAQGVGRCGYIWMRPFIPSVPSVVKLPFLRAMCPGASGHPLSVPRPPPQGRDQPDLRSLLRP